MEYKESIKKIMMSFAVMASPVIIHEVIDNEAEASNKIGWVKTNSGTWYYYDTKGNIVKNKWIGNYYLGSTGVMETNKWIGNYYVDNTGKWVSTRKLESKKTGWQKVGSSWYYYDSKGSIVKNKWIGNYYLGSTGVMETNKWIGNYYVDNTGKWVSTRKLESKKTGWQKVGTSWYYYDSKGNMVKNKWVGNYYLGSTGVMETNKWIGNYYVDNTGKWVSTRKLESKKTGWQKVGSSWYYYDSKGSIVKNKWIGNYYLGSTGVMETNKWIGNYYVDNTGKWVSTRKLESKKTGWQKVGTSWYYYDSKGNMVKNKWVGNYYLGSTGVMETNKWIGNYYVDNTGKWVSTRKLESKKTGWQKVGSSWYYYDSKGSIVKNKWIGNYYLGSTGVMETNKWIGNYYVDATGKWVSTMKKESKNTSVLGTQGYYKVTSLYIPVYDANGKILSHISQGTIVHKDNRSYSQGRIPIQIAGLTGYVNPSGVQAINEKTTFIPDYVSDGKYVYHRYTKSSKLKVAYHNPNMVVGKSYYSADGINFGSFKLDHPFQFSNLKSKTNYSAHDINRLYSIMGANNSKLAGKGATFKAAEQRYGVNALYLVAHSALESAWGRSNIAKNKNNFFGIAAYDSSPYTSATKFDNVDGGILGAARWINEKYLTGNRYPARGAYLGNKAGGMNVNYATAPFWGESIASIMFEANERLGRKDK